MKYKIPIITGCRPDIIKTWPVYKALSQYPQLQVLVLHSGQHDTLADQAFNDFDFSPDLVLDIKKEDRLELGYLHSAISKELTSVFKSLEPDMVLVHGDTTTAFSGAVAAFLRNIPIGHVEAGLRTSRFEYPFPEEGYRRAISRLTTLHFAPTIDSANNLYKENIINNVHLTGNTIVDSLKYVLNKYPDKQPYILPDRRYILVTAHRRETYGKPLLNLCSTLARIAISYPDITIVWPVHDNPNIFNTVHHCLDNINNIELTKPMGYQHFIKLLSSVDIIITDSGGVMEECGILQKPTIILRTETERPECLGIDNIKLIGYDFEELLNIINKWYSKPIKRSQKFNDLFGDGTSGDRIAQIIYKYFKDKK